MLKQDRIKRKRRIRGRLSGSESSPRVSVFKSNKHIYAQVIDDTKAVTLVSVSDTEIKSAKANKTQLAGLVGEEVAKKATAAKIKQVVFDRSGYRYHGRVKSLAEGLRKGGLKV